MDISISTLMVLGFFIGLSIVAIVIVVAIFYQTLKRWF